MGGAIYNTDTSSLFISNSILYGNSSEIENALNATANIVWSIIQTPSYYNPTNSVDTANPLFVHAPSFAVAPFTIGDYQLQFCSPAINTGNNDSIATGISTDLAGNLRIKGSIVDLGAYEKQSEISSIANNAALSKSNSNAFAFLPTCEENDWTYYADPNNPDSISFAIKWGNANNAAKNIADILLTVSSTHHLASNNVDTAIVMMGRYWNVDLHNATLSAPVSVRFFFKYTDTTDMHTMLNNANVGTSANLFWLKTTDTFYSHDLVAPDDINNGNYITLNPVYGSENGIAYVQFDTLNSFSGGTAGIVAGASTPLDVTLLDFRATLAKEKNAVLLDWKVVREDLNRYEILRSTDALTFHKIGKVNAIGNSHYTFTDHLADVSSNKETVLYYKLRLIDNDENTTYSKLVSTNLYNILASKVLILPNPASEHFAIRNVALSLEGKEVDITDATGRVVFRFTLKQNVQVDVSSWSKGIYILKLPNGQIEKLVKE